METLALYEINQIKEEKSILKSKLINFVQFDTFSEKRDAEDYSSVSSAPLLVQYVYVSATMKIKRQHFSRARVSHLAQRNSVRQNGASGDAARQKKPWERRKTHEREEKKQPEKSGTIQVELAIRAIVSIA